MPILALWWGLAIGLAAITTRVTDWFAMPNEMLYERRAISVAQTLSPLPRVRGEFVSTYDQLYPVLVAPAFRWGSMTHDLWAAHALNAWIMSSACIPAFLLARRIAPTRWIAYTVALVSVVMPWIVFSSFLFTEVAAYPAFLWAVLALQASTAAPSRRHDLLALLAIAVAFAGRTQLALLLAVLPAAIVARELGRTRGIRPALRVTVESHRLLAGIYVALATAAMLLAALGRLPSVLGVYGATIGGTGSSLGGSIAPSGTPGALVGHLATLALGLGILPLVGGFAWLLANLVRPADSGELHAFACVGAITFVALLVEVTIFDQRFGERFVHDRYLFYLVPLVVLAFLCAATDDHPPRWSLVPSAGLVGLGFAVGELPRFTWEQFATVNSDAPIAAFYRPVVRAFDGLGAARAGLVLGTFILTFGFFLAARLGRRRLTALSAGFVLVTLPLLTGYMFVRLFAVDGWSSRPLTHAQVSPYDWVDRTVGAGANVAMAPYPVSSAYFVNQRAWRDYEFWNRSVRRDVQVPNASFLYTGDTFTKLYPRFDPRTGLANGSLAPYVLQANQETRFRIAGTVQVLKPDVMLIDAGDPWRLDWKTAGLYPDGWTRPGTTARVRVFALPGQRRSVSRSLSLAFRAPESAGSRTVIAASNLERWRGTASAETIRTSLRLCVPAKGFTEVRLRAVGASELPGDLRYVIPPSRARDGGVLVTEIALADEVGPQCKPHH